MNSYPLAKVEMLPDKGVSGELKVKVGEEVVVFDKKAGDGIFGDDKAEAMM